MYNLITTSIYTPFEHDYTNLLLIFENLNSLITSLDVLYKRDLLAPLPQNFNFTDETNYNLQDISDSELDEYIQELEKLNNNGDK